jgi:hypothetical protein
MLLVLASIAAMEFGFPVVGCNIKGKISRATGERTYLTADQDSYSRARVKWLRGERWFCSEQAARAAGWQKRRG